MNKYAIHSGTDYFSIFIIFRYYFLCYIFIYFFKYCIVIFFQLFLTDSLIYCFVLIILYYRYQCIYYQLQYLIFIQFLFPGGNSIGKMLILFSIIYFCCVLFIYFRHVIFLEKKLLKNMKLLCHLLLKMFLNIKIYNLGIIKNLN